MLKTQCGSCGHRIAVPDNYAGKRVKCPKCQGAVQIAGAPVAAARSQAAHTPRTAAAAVAAPTPDDSRVREAKARRRALDKQRKSHNTTVAIFAGFLLVVGLGVMLVIGMNNRPEQTGPGEIKSPSSSSATVPGGSSLKPIGANGGRSKSGGTTTMGSANPTPIASTSTFDAAAGMTTLVSQPSPVMAGDKPLQMIITIRYDGQEPVKVTDVSATLRLKGRFEGLVSGADTDEPQLMLMIDGREVEFKPSAHDESDTRKEENGPEILPGWVEYSLGYTELMALAKSNEVAGTLGPATFAFTPEQLALFRMFEPPRPVAPAVPVEGDSAEKTAADKDSSEEPVALDPDPLDESNTKEAMDKEEMMKK